MNTAILRMMRRDWMDYTPSSECEREAAEEWRNERRRDEWLRKRQRLAPVLALHDLALQIKRAATAARQVA